HIIPRLQKVIDGEDQGGISKAVNWQGGGFRYFRLAPTLIVNDKWGNQIINPDYNPEMLAEALAKLEGLPDFSWILELGSGFAFVGRQYRLEVNGDEFFIDLLFYHIRLKCYVVVELKAAAFKPEHAGQLNFYLAAVDAQVKAPDDNPTIGLLLCKTQNRLVAEYALSDIDKPIGIAEYELVRALPEPLVTNLPTVEQLESELSDWQEDGEFFGV
ncbi:PDDEXK nuclease domain-containing protein, partial [Aggregatibacter actinomycetemcomitans]|uniref:PDDEXK nuclease domain-containing protein n=1 Tax=Aggregatibacter actinomycetemcomitans TaxID=714 RepID=UPI001E3E65FF